MAKRKGVYAKRRGTLAKRNGNGLDWATEHEGLRRPFRWSEHSTAAPMRQIFTSTLGNRGLSHISFYDTGTTAPIPLPAAGWLMVAGLGGLAALRRRKTA